MPSDCSPSGFTSLRASLDAEFHARPPRPLTRATRIRHYAFLHRETSAGEELEPLDRLVSESGWVLRECSDAYRLLERAGHTLRWELHTEFSSYTVFSPFESADDTEIEKLIMAWCWARPGECLVAMRIDHSMDATMTPESAAAAHSRAGEQIVVSSIVDGRACLITDFRATSDETHFLLLDRGMTPRQAGRTVQRIWEIETYRLLALLGLPTAKAMAPWLRRSEDHLATLMDGIGSARSTGAEESVLDQLSVLAAEVEHSLARTAFRFGACRAYLAIVLQRIAELREQRVTGFPPLREFMDRRLMPPMAMCDAMASRQEDLSERIARNSQLLRTRVEISLERQNQELLVQMNRRARVQLHLQETVEGLSVVAITYYGSQLVHYMAEGLHAVGLAVSADLVTALSIPGIAVLVWWGLRRTRVVLLKE
ncbi:MAG: DUF3422 domain-containing protein [Rhodocyclaceae bacterium]|jgi:uncharacterized membrane-anchored protein|nr:DUF3422 domain-containing protein [Rhodocyclaceae bacterium]